MNIDEFIDICTKYIKAQGELPACNNIKDCGDCKYWDSSNKELEPCLLMRSRKLIFEIRKISREKRKENE